MSDWNRLVPAAKQTTSDITIFLEKDLADTHTDSLPDLVTRPSDISPSRDDRRRPQHRAACLFSNRPSSGGPTRSLLRAIESEIERHTAKVKHQKAVDHLSTQGRKDDKDDSSRTQLFLTDALPNKPGTVLLGKASSPDMSIKQRLVRPSLKPSIAKLLRVPTKKKLTRRIQKQLQSEDAVLKINPFRVNKNLDLLELREMHHQSKRRQQEPPIIRDPQARIQYQVFNDNRLLCPVFNFRKTMYMEEGKNRVRIQEKDGLEGSKKSHTLFRFRDVPQLLSVTRRNRRMYRETKWDVVNRIRETNQCNISLAIKRRMIDYLNKAVEKFDKDIVLVEEETEEFARDFDEYLRQNDDKAIASIQSAKRAVRQRQTAEQNLRTAQMHKNLLNNHNLRTREKIRYLDRFINLLYASAPVDKRETYLTAARIRKEESDSQGALSWSITPNGAQHRTVAESLARYASLSDESESEDLNQPDSVGEDVPPLPVAGVSEAIRLLATNQKRCATACHSMAEAEDAVDLLHDLINQETIDADCELENARRCLNAAEEEVDSLDHEVKHLLGSSTSAYCGQSQADFRQPITALQDQVGKIYADHVTGSDVVSGMPTMLMTIKNVIMQFTSSMQLYPPRYVKRWYETVQTNRNVEQRLIITLEKEEKAIVARMVNHPDVIPQRQLKPRSLPPDHGKLYPVEVKPSLDKIVEKIEEEAHRIAAAKVAAELAEVERDPVTDATSRTRTAIVTDMSRDSSPNVPKGESSLSFTGVNVAESNEFIGTTAAFLTLPKSELVLDQPAVTNAGAQDFSSTVPQKESKPTESTSHPTENAGEVPNIAEVGLVEPAIDEDKSLCVHPQQDYPDDVLADVEDNHPRLDDIFAAVERDEEAPVVKNTKRTTTVSDRSNSNAPKSNPQSSTETSDRKSPVVRVSSLEETANATLVSSIDKSSVSSRLASSPSPSANEG